MVYLLLADGFEDIEAVAPIDILRRAKVPLTTVGVTGRKVVSKYGLSVETDAILSDIKTEGMEMLVLPGGPGVQHFKANPAVLELVKAADREGRLIAAICAGPTVLAELGLLSGRRAVCFPGCVEELVQHGARIETDKQVTSDRNIITGQAAGSAIEFALKLVAMLRGWAASEKVRAEIYYEGHGKALT